VTINHPRRFVARRALDGLERRFEALEFMVVESLGAVSAWSSRSRRSPS